MSARRLWSAGSDSRPVQTIDRFTVHEWVHWGPHGTWDDCTVVCTDCGISECVPELEPGVWDVRSVIDAHVCVPVSEPVAALTVEEAAEITRLSGLAPGHTLATLSAIQRAGWQLTPRFAAPSVAGREVAL